MAGGLSRRERRQMLKEKIEKAYGLVKSMGHREIVGELVDLELGVRGISILDTSEEMGFEKTGLVKGQHVFAQADSLALATADAEVALTGLANAKFKIPVKVGERLVAKAEVIRRKGNRSVVLVQTRAGADTVFRGKFVVASLAGGGGESEA